MAIIGEKTAKKLYQATEDFFVGGYKKMGLGAVDGFTKVSDKATEVLFGKNGESVETTKARLKARK